MPNADLADLPEEEVFPGYFARYIRTTELEIAYWRIVAGADIPEHNHPEERITNVISGEFELTVDQTPHRLSAGMAFIIPVGVYHSGRALTECRLIEVCRADTGEA